jgi:hypothetical protein
MEDTMRLEEWSVCIVGDHYVAPENCFRAVQGKVYGHPHRPDGTMMRTSALADVHGMDVSTASGSTYRLGKPSADYLEWLKREGIAFDPKRPIKDVSND